MDWSLRHNLIARSTIDERWRRHYLDSVQLVPLLPASFKTLADLGSGAGFPGLILAALLEDRQVPVTLIESVGKKAAFLNAAGEAMRLSNLKVIPARIESLKLDPRPRDHHRPGPCKLVEIARLRLWNSRAKIQSISYLRDKMLGLN